MSPAILDSCEFCGELITKEFSYSESSKYCRRPYCAKNRGRLRLDLEEIDRIDDALAELSCIDTPEGVVPTRAEITEESAPLAKARVLATSTDRSIAKPETTPVREMLCTPGVARPRRKPSKADPNLRDRVRAIEDKVFSWSRIYDATRDRGRPDRTLKTPPTLSPEDAIRNQWILEKNKQGIAVATLIPEHVPQKDVNVERIDFLKAYGLVPKDLASWIRDPRFTKLMAEPGEEDERAPREKYRDTLSPIREHFEIRTVKGPDGTMIEHPVLVIPPTRAHRRKGGAKVPLPVKPKEQTKKRALKDRERKMYLDYADGVLSTEQMIAKHGVWADDEIRALELKILRHAERAGLFVVPVQSKEGPVELSDAELPLVWKTGGENLGLTIHRRTRNSFATGPVRESSGNPGRDKQELPGFDDYSEDSAA